MDHVSDCYFCLTNITCVTAKSKHTVQYPNLPSAMRPVPHSVELPVPKPPTSMTLSGNESSDEDVGQANNNMDCDPTFAETCPSNEPHLLTHRDLNDIVHNLNLSKKQAELLSSKLKGWNLLRQDTKVSFYPGRQEDFKDFFSWKVVSCFAMMFVLLWKFLAMNITQNYGTCSLICQSELEGGSTPRQK